VAVLAMLHRDDTHRLVPAKHSENGSVLENLGLPAEVLSDLSEIDAATNDRKIAERGGNPAIGPSELLMGVPEAHVVNAAFSHPNPLGSRFNNSRRGAWYAAFNLETAFAEVTYHKRRFLKDMRVEEAFSFEYRDFLANFDGMFHHLEAHEQSCLLAEPVPQCYADGQMLALLLLHGGSAGIVYRSVRHPQGTCIACFRPALIFHVRRGSRYKVTLSPTSDQVITEALLDEP